MPWNHGRQTKTTHIPESRAFGPKIRADFLMETARESNLGFLASDMLNCHVQVNKCIFKTPENHVVEGVSGYLQTTFGVAHEAQNLDSD